MSIRLVLASGSPARLATLRAAGIEPEVAVSQVDEDAALAAATTAAGRDLTVSEQVAELARCKAEAVASTVPDGAARLVLGGDSLLKMAGKAHGKPATAQRARERWAAMSGGSGTLYTGHHLIDLATGEAARGVSATLVHFARLTPAEIDAYVATGEPLAVAGAFTIDGLGGGFVTRIEGDHHGVVGLSLPLLRTLVGELGLDYTDLWNLPILQGTHDAPGPGESDAAPSL